jgi:ribosomal protein S18 acetylase RimI-like enzyme
VADEVYGGLWAQPPLDLGEQDWSRSWVAVVEDEIVGVVLTGDDWLDDLWVARRHRRHGVGSRLLRQAESEIASRGFQAGRLRVVASNAEAIMFYRRNGWQEEREYAHESLPVLMLEMSKRLK